MKAGEMVKGKFYRLLKDKQIVELAFRSEDSMARKAGHMIVHPPGEYDMQSKFGVSIDEDVEIVSEAEAKEYVSPYNNDE